MKKIKIILGIIIALTLVFFGTGLIVKETKYTAEVEINKPINEVFTLFDSNEALKKWMPEIKSIEPINETPQKLGSTYKVILENEGQKIEMQEKVRAYIPNEKITLLFNLPEMIKIDDYNFIANGDKTKVVQHSSVRANSFMLACTFPWFKGRFKDLNQDYLARFKELAENTDTSLSKE